MPLESSQLPRVFQANIDRLYLRVVRGGLDRLPTHAEALVEATDSETEALARLARQVDNHTAEEARRAFALMLAAAFERQLRLFGRMVLPATEADNVARREIMRLLDRVTEICSLALAPGVRADIEEMSLLANVVRHGDGRSCDALRRMAPRLWSPGMETFDQAMPAFPLTSNGIRVGADDLRRYAAALIRFWGAADTLPLPALDATY